MLWGMKAMARGEKKNKWKILISRHGVAIIQSPRKMGTCKNDDKVETGIGRRISCFKCLSNPEKLSVFFLARRKISCLRSVTTTIVFSLNKVVLGFCEHFQLATFLLLQITVIHLLHKIISAVKTTPNSPSPSLLSTNPTFNTT